MNTSPNLKKWLGKQATPRAVQKRPNYSLRDSPKSVLEDVLKPPFPHGYQAIKEQAIESTKSKQLIDSIINQCPNQGGSTGNFQRPNNGGFQGGVMNDLLLLVVRPGITRRVLKMTDLNEEDKDT